MYANETFFKTRLPNQPKNNVPIMLNKPIRANDQPAVSKDKPFEIKSLGRCKAIKVTWKPQVKKPKDSKI